MRNMAIQLVLLQCYKTSCTFFVARFSVPLRSDDGNENVIKAIGLISKTTTLHVHHTFLYISLPSLHNNDVKMLNFMFYRGHKQAATNFLSSFLTWIRLLGIQLQKSSRALDKVSANSLFKRRFTCRRRPRILRSQLPSPHNP